MKPLGDKMDSVRRREVARRIFSKELNDSTYVIREGEDKSPVYILTPLGLRCNRVFIIGALLEKEEVRPDSGVWRIRLADPTGVFIGYVGRFQPNALESLLEIEPPALISVVSKVRIFEGTTRTFVFLRPEQINLSDASSRDYWIVETAKATLKRINSMEKDENEDVKLAKKIYNTNLEEYRRVVREVLTRIKEEYEIFEKIAKEEEAEEEEEFEFELEEEEWDLSDLLED